MRGFLAALLLTICSSWLAASSFALDCAKPDTETERLLCQSEELERANGVMTGGFQVIAQLMKTSEFQRLARDQNLWLASWARACGRDAPSDQRVACLPELRTRSKFIHDLAEQLSAARYLGQSIEIGGHSLVIKAGAHGSNKLYLGDRVVSDYAYRIEPRVRFSNDSVDALVFVVNAGGAAYICSNFPVYIVAVRSGGPPEITRVPSTYARRRDEACVDPHRTATGLKFTARPQAGLDGWSQEWTPEGGLTPPTIIPFAPRPGTTMKNDGGGVLIGNEQFFRTLQRLATESGQSPATLVEAFAQVSAENKVLVDKLPDHLSMFSGCSTPGLPWTCRSDTEPAHVVYDSKADRLYFVLVKGGVGCEYAWQHREGPNDLAGSIFLPPREQWPDEILTSLKRSYCGPH